MKTNVVPILVTLRRGVKDGKRVASWPDFDRVPSEIRCNLTWPVYIDTYGIGWHYDKISNLGMGADTEVAGTVVPMDFADAAQMLFPDVVTIVSEEKFADFWDNRSKIKDETEHLDTDILQGILARVQLEEMGLAEKPSPEILELRKRCLDPYDTNRRGIRKNHMRKWADAKICLGVELHK